MKRTQLLLTAKRAKRGFTLIELMVVIGIIVVLIGLLLPAANAVRKQAMATNTRAQLGQLGAQIQAYFGDFNSYPGPIPNSQLRTAGSPNNVTVPAGIGPTITMAENLYLGLMGGLKRGATDGEFEFDRNIAGLGPRSLGTNPKKLTVYGDNTDMTSRLVAGVATGDFADEAADCADSSIPEFLDRFPSPMPLLYLRARTGIQSTTPAVVSTNPSTTAQYDLTQVSPYTSPVGGNYIGEGKSDDKVERVPMGKNFYEHGFTSTDVPKDTAVTAVGAKVPKLPGPDVVGDYFYPYNINAALRHPTLANTPKQQNGYILISAGIDRVYGTKDDITNFGDY